MLKSTSQEVAPTRALIVQFLTLAESSAGVIFEVNWPSTATSEASFLLQAYCPSNSNKPNAVENALIQVQWTMATRDAATTQTLWTYATRDVGLVVNLVNSHQEPDLQFQKGKEVTFQPLASPQPIDNDSSHSPERLKSLPDLSLSGDLSNIDLDGLLQSLQLWKVNGKLSFCRPQEQIDLFFREGILHHAAKENLLNNNADTALQGTSALFELLLWESGSFRLYPEWSSNKTTIERKLDGLLLEGATIQDYKLSLLQNGFNNSAILLRTNNHWPSVEPILKCGLQISLTLQKRLYDGCSNPVPASQLLQGISEHLWVPALFNLINCQVIKIVAGSEGHNSINSVIALDDLLLNATLNVFQPGLKIVHSPTFLFCLKREVDTARSLGHPISLVIFGQVESNRQTCADVQHHLQAVSTAFSAINDRLELLGEIDSSVGKLLCIVYPEQTSIGSLVRTEKLIRYIKEQDSCLNFSFGISSFPEDANNLESLLNYAYLARKRADDEGKTISLFNRQDTSRWNELRLKADNAFRLGYIDEAIDLFAACLREAKNGDKKNSQLLYTLETLSDAFIKIRDFEKAEHVLELQQEIAESTNWLIGLASCLAKLGQCYYELGKYEQAEPILIRTVKITERLHGQNSAPLAHAYCNLGNLYHLTENYQKAAVVYQEAFTITRKLWGINHQETIKILNNLQLAQRRSQSPDKEQGLHLISGTWRSLKIEDPDKLTDS